MMQLSSKNDDSILCYDVINTFKTNIDKFCDFSSDIDYNRGQAYFWMSSPL